MYFTYNKNTKFEKDHFLIYTICMVIYVRVWISNIRLARNNADNHRFSRTPFSNPIRIGLKFLQSLCSKILAAPIQFSNNHVLIYITNRKKRFLQGQKQLNFLSYFYLCRNLFFITYTVCMCTFYFLHLNFTCFFH